MRISDWSSDVCSSDLFFDFFVYAIASVLVFPKLVFPHLDPLSGTLWSFAIFALAFVARPVGTIIFTAIDRAYGRGAKLTIALFLLGGSTAARSEEHTSELQSLMRISSAVFCLTKKKDTTR